MSDRVAIVSGGTGGLGQSVARKLLADGARVVIPYAVSAELESLKSRLGAAAKDVEAALVDVTDEAAFNQFVERTVASHGRVDAIVNGVGGFAGGDLASTSLEDWDKMIALNLRSAAIGCRAVLPAMTKAGSGRIVNVASRAALTPMGGFVAYTVGKAGVVTLTQALARELPRGITVNAVAPSTMDTPANRRAMPDADRSSWVSTDAVATVIAYLASDAAGMISGAVIPV